MTFKDLEKRILLENPISRQQTELSSLFQKVKGKPFWIWGMEDVRTNGDCCFNHIVGLPIKDGKEFPLFDYEKLLFDNLFTREYNNPFNLKFKQKHLWIKKATGLGITEFMLRVMTWLCTNSGANGHYVNSHFVTK